MKTARRRTALVPERPTDLDVQTHRTWLRERREEGDIEAIKDASQRARMIRDFEKVSGGARDKQNNAARIHVWAEFELAGCLADARKQGELASRGRPKKLPHGQDNSKNLPHGQVFTLADIGLSEKRSKRCNDLLSIGEPDIGQFMDSLDVKEITLAAVLKLGRQPTEYDPEQPDFDPPEVWHMAREEWLPTQPECDLLLTDPPYMTDLSDVESFAGEWLPEALNKVKTTGRAYICIGAYPQELWSYLNNEAPDHLVMEQVLVWTYRNTLGQSPKDVYKLNWQAILYYRGVDAPPLTVAKTADQFSVFDINAPDGRLGDRCHTWQKPSGLAEIIVNHATREGDLVLDPFCCTGTFLLAANKLGRIGRGCDNDYGNLKLALKRGCVEAS